MESPSDSAATVNNAGPIAIDVLVEAKAVRDTIRGAILKALRHIEVTPEISALLAADDRATAQLSSAVQTYDQHQQGVI